jgi:hypothetical protein
MILMSCKRVDKIRIFMNRFILISALVMVMATCSAIAAQEGGLDLSGQLQSDLSAVQAFEKPLAEHVDFAGLSTFTLNAKNRRASTVKVETSVDLIMLYGAYADAITSYLPQEYFILTNGSAPFLLDIRKLYAALFLPFADISVGRQIINFGQGFAFSPVDAFTTVNTLDLTFKRRGSDVARVRIPFGALSGADVVAKLASRAQGAVGAAKLYTNLSGFDVSAIGMYRGDRDEISGGLAFKGDLLAGVYGELVEHWPAHGAPHLIGMAGADYSISSTWFFNAEYQYIEHPEADNAVPGMIMPFSGRHNAFASVRYAFNDLMSVSVNGLADFSAESGVITGQYSYNVLQNANAIVFVRYFKGDFPVLGQATAPDMQYGLRLEVSF